jgi:hypothetical protein
MFAIEATNNRQWQWIAGIFLQRTEAEAFLQAASRVAGLELRMVDLPVDRYPFLIVEKRGFEYGGIDLIRARLAELTPAGDEDHIHMNIYAVYEDFAPAKPGSDYMGALEHWHIGDDQLKPPRSLALDKELSEIVGV